jgi:hypothetical protein
MFGIRFTFDLLRNNGGRRRKPTRTMPALQGLEDRHLLSLSFAPAVTLPVGLRPESVVTADLNGDGKQDIVVLNQGQFPDLHSSVSVLLGNGDGTFQTSITTDVLPGANSVAVGDFHGDGHLDLVLANRLTDVVEVLRGNGDGTFQGSPTLLPIPPNHAIFPGITSVAVGDFRHRGTLDIAATSAGSNTVSVFLGNGDGTFQGRVDYAVGAFPESVVAADLGNGQVDLVVANHDSSDVSVLLGNGDGSFQPAQNIDVNAHLFGADSSPITLAVGDFNGDGKPDSLVSQEADFFEEVATVVPGNGDGTFQAPIHRDVGFGLIGLAVGDFNGDGNLDFATADDDAALGAFTANVFLGNGDGTFGDRNVFRTGGSFAFGIAAGDFKGDERLGLVVANTFSNDVSVLLNTSTVATATALSADVSPAVVGQPVNLTAMVTGPAGIPGGTVTFMDGATVLGTAPLDNTGTATLAVTFTAAGDHPLTAVYSGQVPSTASTSDVLTETVNPAPTAVVLTPSVVQGLAGVPVTFTVTVSPVAPGAGVPTGAVTVLDGDTVLGTAQLDENGQAVLTLAFDAGDHSLTVSYDGDDNFQSALSGPLDLPIV